MRDRLGEDHERAVPASERHGRGQYFTPFPLIDLVLDLCAEPPSVVLDPACGSGRFLMAAGSRWPGAVLRGADTDAEALRLCRANVPMGELSERSFLEAAPTGDVDLLVGNPPYVRRRGQKRDLYVDFIERAADWLRPGGRLAFVLSSAWLDVAYGAEVRGILADRFAVEWIVESSAERWFPNAKVNTMVLVARREEDAGRRAAASCRLATIERPLPAAPVVGRERSGAELASAGAWGPLLRAPSAWLEARGALPCLGDLATVRRGYTTNDNAFFYPSAGSGVEAACLRPLLKSPRNAPGVRARASALTDRVFVCDDDMEGLDAKGRAGAKRWIVAHGRDRHPRGWRLPPQEPARLFVVKGYGDRFRQPLFDSPVACDQQLYQALPAPGIDERALAAVLNSGWARLGLELLGRVNFGDGVLWLGLEDARSLPLPDPRRAQPELIAAFDALPGGPVPPAPLLAHDPLWRGPVARLDALIWELLGVAPRDGDDLVAAGAALCLRRTRKAARVGSR